MPTYNEKQNIRNSAEQLLSLNANVDLLIVDDNSPDATGDIAEELALPPVKIHCSILAEDAIKAAIEDYKKKTNE